MSEQLEHGTHKDAIRSFVGTVQALVAVEAERDAALATIARVRVVVDDYNSFRPLSNTAGNVLDEISAALEATS